MDSHQNGHIELERRIDSILVGERHRRDLGDLTPLMNSLARVGLLQPVTITPDGYLIGGCGLRRLEAARRLGWTTLRVWVRSGISDELTRLLAQRDADVTHKPLAAAEAARLYQELVGLMKEDAARRKKATQFRSQTSSRTSSRTNWQTGDLPGDLSDDLSDEPPDPVGQPGPADSAAPQTGRRGDARRLAAEMVTGKASYARLEQIIEMERIAADRTVSATQREVAETELEAIRNGGPVDPGWQRVKAAQRAEEMMNPTHGGGGDRGADIDRLADEVLAHAKADRAHRIKENRARRAAAAASAKRSPRAFVLTWTELDGWSKKYDADQIAREIKANDWALFLHVLDETKAFADAVALARKQQST